MAMKTTKNVLVCEDDPVQLKILTTLIDQAGYRSLSARTPSEAVVAARRCGVDAVLTDVQLQDGNAFDLVGDLHRFGFDAPVLMTSAYATEGMKDRARKAGAKFFFEKPFNLPQIREQMDRVLNAPRSLNATLLLVEAHTRVRSELHQSIVAAGFHVISVEDGPRAMDALQAVLLTAGFVALMLGLGLPIVRRVLPRVEGSKDLGRTGLTVLLVAMLISAMATEYIGIHALFGAFLFGAIIPHHTRTASGLKAQLDDVVAVLFLPAFFALTGMRTQLGLVSGGQSWLLCGAIILVACAGKFGGTLLAARGVGFSWQNAAALGALMNTRGLVELIVLNIGLDLKVISPTLFTMLVLMALVTTMMTTPLLRLILRGRSWAELKAVSAIAHTG